MLNIWEEDCELNPYNIQYRNMADTLKMDDWLECKRMYKKLHPVVREELDNFLYQVKSMESWAEIMRIRDFENQPSKIGPTTGLLVA